MAFGRVFIKDKIHIISKIFKHKRSKQYSLYFLAVAAVGVLIFVGVYTYYKVKQAGDNPTGSAWPSMGHDAQHSKKSPSSGPRDINERWTFSDARTPGLIYSQGILNPNGTKIYIGVGNYYVRVKTTDGTANNFRNVGSNIVTSPVISAKGTYFGCQDGKLYKFDANEANFNEIWTYDTGYAFRKGQSPIVDSNNIIYFTNDVSVYALEDMGNSWSIKWQRSFGASGDIILTAPALDKNAEYLYVSAFLPNSAQSRVYKLLANDGTISAPFNGRSINRNYLTHPVVDGNGNIYIGTRPDDDDPNAYLYSLSPNNLAQNWRWSIESPGSIAFAPAIDDARDRIFFSIDSSSPDYRRLYALKKSTGSVIAYYENKTSNTRFSSNPIVDKNGYVYIGIYENGLYRIRGYWLKIVSFPNYTFKDNVMGSGVKLADQPIMPLLSEEDNNFVPGQASIYVPMVNGAIIAIGPRNTGLTSSKAVVDPEITLGDETTATIRIEGKGTPPRYKKDIVFVLDRTGSMDWCWNIDPSSSFDCYACSTRGTPDPSDDVVGTLCPTSCNPACESRLITSKKRMSDAVDFIASDKNNNDPTNRADRIGYVYYSASNTYPAKVYVPLTFDYEGLKNKINGDEPNGQGLTNTGVGVGLANQHLDLQPNRRPNIPEGIPVEKLILLFSDGGQNPPAAANNCCASVDHKDVKTTQEDLSCPILNQQDPCILYHSIQKGYKIFTLGMSDQINTTYSSGLTFDCDWRNLPGIPTGLYPGRHQEGPVWKCYNPNFDPNGDPLLFEESGACLLQRIADYTDGDYGNAIEGKDMDSVLAGLLEGVMDSIIVEGGNTTIKERLANNIRYRGLEKVVYSHKGETKTYYPSDPNFAEIGTLYTNADPNANGFDFKLNQPLYLNDYVDLHFKISPTAVGYLEVNDLDDSGDTRKSIIEYTKVGASGLTKEDLAQTTISVLPGRFVGGDVHSTNEITISGFATGVVTAQNSARIFTGFLNTFAPYTISASTAKFSDAFNVFDTHIQNLYQEDYKAYAFLANPIYGPWRLFNPDNKPEGVLFWHDDGELYEFPGANNYEGRGTIYINRSLGVNNYIRGNITRSISDNKGAMLGFIVKQGNMIIKSDVTNVDAAIYAPKGDIIIEAGPEPLAINGMLIAKNIIIRREKTTINYDPRILGGFDAVNNILFHPLIGFNQVVQPIFKEDSP